MIIYVVFPKKLWVFTNCQIDFIDFFGILELSKLGYYLEEILLDVESIHFL